MWRIAGMFVVLALLGSSCQERTGSTGRTTEPDRPAAEPHRVTVGGMSGIEFMFLQFAVDRGFFEDERLDVYVQHTETGADSIVGVHDNPPVGVPDGDLQFDIAVAHAGLILLAREDPDALVRHVEGLDLIGPEVGTGLPLRIIGTAAAAATDPERDISQIMVLPDSPVRRPADLAGRTIAVDTASYLTEVAIRRALENAGVDHADLDFVQMPVADMFGALFRGQVDAVHAVEPFVAEGREEGLRPIIAPYAGTEPGLAGSVYFSSDEFVEDNPDTIRRFVAAVEAAGGYVVEHPDEFRQAYADLTGLHPDLVADVNLPSWAGPVDVTSVELIGDLLVRYGLLDAVPPTDEVVYTATPGS